MLKDKIEKLFEATEINLENNIDAVEQTIDALKVLINGKASMNQLLLIANKLKNHVDEIQISIEREMNRRNIA